LVVALVVAIVVHLPFTPLALLMPWLSAWLNRDTSWKDYEDDRVIIPITLLDPPEEEPGGTAAPSTTSEPASPKTPGVTTAGAARDAGATDAGPDAVADAAAHDAASDAPEKVSSTERTARKQLVADAAIAEALNAEALARNGPSDAGAGPSVRDPLSLVGGLRRAVNGEPNVSVVLWFSTIREHPLGTLVGNVLSCIPQWADFIGDLVDPLQDFDGVWIAGPQLRDTSKLTIMAQSRMDDSHIDSVFGALSRRSGGSVLTAPTGMRAIRFHADRADRVALTHPRNMIIVTPPEGFEQLRDLKGPLSLPAGKGRALSLSLVTPWRPARAIGLRWPETLRALRIDVTAASDAGIDIAVELDDESPEAAAQHAPQITDQLRGMGGMFLSDVEFVPKGNRMAAQTHLSRLSGAILLGYIRPMLCPFGLDGGRRR
jgi:hypothetical protein